MNWRRAFTLIELMIVMGIIILIAGFTLAAINQLGIGSKRAKTNTILETVRQAIEVTIAQTGSVTKPAEHPLAGSFAESGKPRFQFNRDDAGKTALSTTAGVIASPTEKIALTGVELTNLNVAEQSRLLLPEDFYADRQVPLLYGMRRDFLTVLGGKLSNVTRFRRLTRPTLSTIVIANPDDIATFPNDQCLVSSTSGPDSNKLAIDYVLGNTNASTELARLGAMFAPPNDDAANQLAYGRCWSKTPLAASGEKKWKPGYINHPDRTQPTVPSWKPYRLRGLAIYDAWGIEILCSVSRSGAFRLLSAGKDGVFRWDPGPNGTIETDAWATAPSGDDKDGALDNVVSNIGGK